MKVYVNHEAVALPQGSAGMGYVKQDISSAVTMNNGNNSRIEIVKESDGTSWGRLYAQFFQSSQR